MPRVEKKDSRTVDDALAALLDRLVLFLLARLPTNHQLTVFSCRPNSFAIASRFANVSLHSIEMPSRSAFAHFGLTTRRFPVRQQASTATQYPKPAVSTALFREKPLSILLIKRGNPPNKHLWSLPGGRLNDGESLIHAARRELHEETSIPSHQVYLLPNPVTHVLAPADNPTYRISVFAGVYTGELLPIAADDAADARFCQLDNISDLPTVPNLETTIHTALQEIQRADFTP